MQMIKTGITQRDTCSLEDCMEFGSRWIQGAPVVLQDVQGPMAPPPKCHTALQAESAEGKSLPNPTGTAGTAPPDILKGKLSLEL